MGQTEHESTSRTTYDFWEWEDLSSGSDYKGPELREWQKRALWHWADNGHTGVVEAITGTGKSLVGIAAIRDTLAKGGCALILVPSAPLLEQWHKSLTTSLPRARIGKLTGDTHDGFETHNVLVATVQTAYKQIPKPKSLGLLVADEVHRYGSAEYSKALDERFERRLGLSGTYERQQDDGVERILSPYFGDIAFSYGYGEALRDQVVAPFHLALVSTEFTQDERRKYDEFLQQQSKAQLKLQREYGYPEDWSTFFALVTRASKSSFPFGEKQLCNKFLDAFHHKRTQMAEARAKAVVLAGIGQVIDGKSGTLVFTETKEGANALAAVLKPITSANALTSDDKSEARSNALKAFEVGNIKALCTPKILDEGVDVPEAELAIVIAASNTKRQMIQRMGRVIRLKNPPRAAKIVIVFVKDTGEDPANGAKEAFLSEIEPHAESVTQFDMSQVDQLNGWLGRA